MFSAMKTLSVIDRRVAPAGCALLLLAIAAGCTPDGQSVATSVPASVEPLDFSALNGKTIMIEGRASGFAADPPEAKILLPVLGKTIVWKYLQESACTLKGIRYGRNLAILYALDQPRTGVKVPCESNQTLFVGDTAVDAPADVGYSSTMSIQGGVLELSGELTEHDSKTSKGETTGLGYTLTKDIKHQQHVKVRISGDKCQVLDFSWTIDVRESYSDGQARQLKRSVRATGCSIVAGYPVGY